MTAQYEQDNINLRDSTPIVVTTLDASPLLVPLGVITDGQTLTVNLFGGGATPASVVPPSSYVLAPGAATFRRRVGVGFVNTIVNDDQSGAPVTFLFTHVDGPTETVCNLSIAALAFPYAHNLRYSAILF